MRHFSVNVRQKLHSPFPVLVTPADGLLKNLQFPGGRSLQNLSPLPSPSSLFALSLSSAKIQYGAQTDVFVRIYEDSFVKFIFSSERVKGSRPSQQSLSFTCDLGAWFRLIRSTTQILARKVDFCGGRKTGECRKTLGVRLRSTNHSPRTSPGSNPGRSGERRGWWLLRQPDSREPPSLLCIMWD